ncbi:MAG TPA: dockerin type I domain-containing protein [Chthoniobacterales bacterium]|nr:dockerin type I domain-containing protein [Chthoniobacterales bacterium]
MVSKTSFFMRLALLSVIPIASGQTAPHRLLPTEPLEKYDNPPAYIFRIETSPRMISQYDLFTSYQVNVDAQGHNILGDAANEPSIAVDPTNPSKMAIGWRQFNSVQSNFRQGGWGYTSDGGTSWTFPGVLENNVFRSDPVLNSNETGNFFYLSLLQSFCDDIWRSLNSGQSWTRLPPEGGGGGGDKEWFTIDKTNGTGHGFQYQAWSTAAACSSGQFSRSTNGGVTWMSPINIPNSPVWGTLDVDTNGNLFIGGGDFGSQFYCIRSSNAQNGNVTPTFDQVTNVNLGGSIEFGAAINPGGLAGQIFLAVDRSGTSTNNNIYMLASVQPTGANNGNDVMFVRSTNGGQTFSAPHRINDDPINHNKWHWLGTLSVAPNGRIDSVWLDTRNASNNTDSQLFYSYSLDGGNTWSANVAVSNPFNPFEGYPNQNKMGDYITIVSDATGGNVAYAATFNFNPNTNQHEEDIYYVRVAPGAPVAQSAFSRKVHGGAGTFDVPLPLTGNVGVECRSGGATNDYQMIVNFASAVTVESVAVTSGSGSVSSFSVSGSQVTVNLTGVTDVQRITVTLHNVNDGTSTGDVPVSMGVLVGDVNGNATVNASDVSLTKSQVGQAVSGSNFREDVNVNGTISATDVALVKSEVGTALPP